MNYREIIGPDELNWKVVLLDWKKIGKEELKLGTPMSKDGVVANDASCYGILMDDVQKDKHFQARVIVSGCVDFAKAEEYSGIKISAEAKKAIGKVWSQGGGGLTELPEGYPYKEKGAVIFPEGEYPLNSRDFEGPTVEKAIEVGKKYKVVWNGDTHEVDAIENPYGDAMPMVKAAVMVTSATSILYVDDGTNPPHCTFTINGNDETAIISMSEAGETIHPIAPEFLPTEEWMFTLEDDTTVTKKVVVAE